MTKKPNLTDLEQQVGELTIDLQRTRADFENFRKQTDLQRDQHASAVKLATVNKLLPLLDDISRAIKTQKDLAPLEKSLEKSLTDLGLSPIPSAQGAPFDPALHEAISVEGEGDTEQISATLRPGYLYEGTLLRPALVKVTKS